MGPVGMVKDCRLEDGPRSKVVDDAGHTAEGHFVATCGQV